MPPDMPRRPVGSSAWFRDRRLIYDEDIAPGGIAALHRGENTGKKLIYVGGAD